MADSKSDSEANLLHTDHNNISEHDGNVGMAYPPMKLPPTPHFIAIMRPSRVTLPMLLTYLRRLVITQPDAEGSGRCLTSNRRCLCKEPVFGSLLHPPNLLAYIVGSRTYLFGCVYYFYPFIFIYFNGIGGQKYIKKSRVVLCR